MAQQPGAHLGHWIRASRRAVRWTKHSEDEQRYLSLDISARGRLLIAAHAEDDEIIRLITCRRATRKERRTYEERR